MRKYFLAAAGLISFALGTAGAALPFLPAAPFYLLTLYCFAKSSGRLHGWFVDTKLYRGHLESFAQKRAMPWRAKLSILCGVTLAMGLSMIFAARSPFASIALAAVWLLHVLYFLFRVKTVKSA